MVVDFIRKAYYLNWLANIIVMKKVNDKWRIYINYTNLNKACPKNYFLLSRINQLVDATSGHKLLNFMDAFSDYNKIRMTPEEEKTTFLLRKICIVIKS